MSAQAMKQLEFACHLRMSHDRDGIKMRVSDSGGKVKVKTKSRQSSPEFGGFSLNVQSCDKLKKRRNAGKANAENQSTVSNSLGKRPADLRKTFEATILNPTAFKEFIQNSPDPILRKSSPQFKGSRVTFNIKPSDSPNRSTINKSYHKRHSLTSKKKQVETKINSEE